jgi:hypothetical protein
MHVLEVAAIGATRYPSKMSTMRQTFFYEYVSFTGWALIICICSEKNFERREGEMKATHVGWVVVWCMACPWN